jgi:molybdopterin converting factor small subunit
LRIKVVAVGSLTWSLPEAKDIVEIKEEKASVQDILKAMISKHGKALREELMPHGRLKDGLSLMLNGRNVLSLPHKFETPIQNGDELIIATVVAGG